MQNRAAVILSLGMLLEKVDLSGFISQVLNKAKEENPEFVFTPELQKQTFILSEQFNQGKVTQEIYIASVFDQLKISRMQQSEFWAAWNNSVVLGNVAEKINLLQELADKHKVSIYLLSDTNPVHFEKIASESKEQNVTLDMTQQPMMFEKFPLYVSYQVGKNRQELTKQIVSDIQSKELNNPNAMTLILGDPANIKNKNQQAVIQKEFQDLQAWCATNKVSLQLHHDSLAVTLKQIAFKLACKKIESDKNYQPNISNGDLLSLVVYENGTPRYMPRKHAAVIQHSDINPVLDGESLGKVSQIKIAGKFWDDYLESSVWGIDDSLVILVNTAGEYSIHEKENAKKNNFNSPLPNLAGDDYLDRESLAFPFMKQQEQIREITKNSQTLARESLSKLSFFAQLPHEVLVKIAAFTGDKRYISEEESQTVANNNFKRTSTVSI